MGCFVHDDPADYIAFRDALGHSSGFQSYQYRILEFLLGNKNRKMSEVHKHDPAVYSRVVNALNAPSLYDETLRLLHRRGFKVPRRKSIETGPYRIPAIKVWKPFGRKSIRTQKPIGIYTS